MKAKVYFSKVQGRNDDKKFHTVAEFCRIVANDVVTDLNGYFLNFYAAYIADTTESKKADSETSADFQNKVFRKAFQDAKSTPVKELQDTELYKIFSSKNQLFKLVRSIMPAYYDAEGCHKFAKSKILAFKKSKLSLEHSNEMQETGYFVIAIKETEYLTKHYQTKDGVFDKDATEKHYTEKLQEQRKQRKVKFSEMTESSIFYLDANDNICTLVDNDKMNFATLYAYVSEYSQRENYTKIATQQQKEKQRKQQLNLLTSTKKLDEKVSSAFNKLLSFRTKVKAEYKNQYIADENKRNLVLADFIRYTTEYKAACQKRFADWKENENPFLQDTGKVVRMLTTQPAVKTAAKKTASTKKETKKAA